MRTKVKVGLGVAGAMVLLAVAAGVVAQHQSGTADGPPATLPRTAS